MHINMRVPSSTDPFRLGLIIAVAAAIFSTSSMPAQGSATLTDDDRWAHTAVWIDHEMGGSSIWMDEWDSFNYPNTDYSTFNVNEATPVVSSTVVPSIGSGQASVMQSSTLNGNSTFDSLTIHGSATGQASLASSETLEVTANAYGWSKFQIDFSIAAPHDWSIAGSIARSDPSSANSNVEIILSELGGGQLYFQNQVGSFGFAGTLDPGSYRLYCLAWASEVIGENMSSDNSASFSNVVFTLVPEPSALLVLGLGVPLISARRIRRLP